MKPKSTPDPASLRERALAYLARREHSRFELTRKLEAAGFAVEEIAPVLDEFEDKTWLSDQRFAESYVANHHPQAGNIKLTHDLRQRGIADSLIETVLNNHRENEPDRAHKVWQKKFGSEPADATEKARQIRFLLGRGFSSGLIHHILSRTN